MGLSAGERNEIPTSGEKNEFLGPEEKDLTVIQLAKQHISGENVNRKKMLREKCVKCRSTYSLITWVSVGPLNRLSYECNTIYLTGSLLSAILLVPLFVLLL